MQLTVIDDAQYRPGWFRIGHNCVFAPPKTGFTGLKSLLPHSMTGLRVPTDHAVHVAVRDPFARFVSQYTMMVVYGWGRNLTHTRLSYMGQSFVDQWFPQTVDDPVSFAKLWLEGAWPQLEHAACDYHVISQSRALRGLLGQDPTHSINLIDYTRMDALLATLGVHGYKVENPTRYSVAPSMYESLRTQVYQMMPDDCAMYATATINTI